MTTPVNPDATAALVDALRAIVDYYGYIGYFLTDKHIEDANNALHMAQLPDADENALRRKAWADRQQAEMEAAQWMPISELDKSEMSFVLCDECGAQRTMLWNPKGYWEYPDERGGHPAQNYYPNHFRKLPKSPYVAGDEEEEYL